MNKEIVEYDANGRVAYIKTDSGREVWWEHNEKGLEVYSKCSTYDKVDYEIWNEYDEISGNIIKETRKYNQITLWDELKEIVDHTFYEYDENGKLKYKKSPVGSYSGYCEEWFDAEGNIVKSNKKVKYEYDPKTGDEYTEYSDGFKVWKSKGHYKDSSGFEYWNEYDEEHKVHIFRNSLGVAEVYSKNNLLYRIAADGYEEWYDSNGNVIKEGMF